MQAELQELLAKQAAEANPAEEEDEGYESPEEGRDDDEGEDEASDTNEGRDANDGGESQQSTDASGGTAGESASDASQASAGVSDGAQPEGSIPNSSPSSPGGAGSSAATAQPAAAAAAPPQEPTLEFTRWIPAPRARAYRPRVGGPAGRGASNSASPAITGAAVGRSLPHAPRFHIGPQSGVSTAAAPPAAGGAGGSAAASAPETVPEPACLKALARVLRRLGVPVLELAFFRQQDRPSLVVRDPNDAARGSLHALHAVKDSLAPSYAISRACEAGVERGSERSTQLATREGLAALLESGEDHGRDARGRKLRLRWGALSSEDMDTLVQVRHRTNRMNVGQVPGRFILFASC